MAYFVTLEDGRKIKVDDVLPIRIKDVEFILHQSASRYGVWTITEAETGRVILRAKTMLEAIQELIVFVKENGVQKIIDRKKELNHR